MNGYNEYELDFGDILAAVDKDYEPEPASKALQKMGLSREKVS